MTRVSGRTHSNGVVTIVMRFKDDGHVLYTPEVPPPAHVRVTGRHNAEKGAQAEADQILAANDHVCGDGCSPWTPTAAR